MSPDQETALLNRVENLERALFNMVVMFTADEANSVLSKDQRNGLQSIAARLLAKATKQGSTLDIDDPHTFTKFK